MLPEMPDLSRRAQLTEWMDEPCSREQLQACLRDLARVNRWLLGYRPVLRWLDSLDLQQLNRPMRILDVGFGYGDTLRRMERWARERKVAVELVGIDLNPEAVAIAAEASPATSKIEWIRANVFEYSPRQPFQFIVSSLFTHHLAEEDGVRFLKWMERRAELGWFINDLSRAAIPYHLFRAFSTMMGLHPFVRHDGPVSIARAFVPEDWRRMCAAAGLGRHDVSIEGYTPGRLCVRRRRAQ
jgi:SAM-dependent methyltransferase